MPEHGNWKGEYGEWIRQSFSATVQIPIWVLRLGWNWWREVSGDAAYQTYLRWARERGDCEALMSRDEFYLDSLRRRYSGPTRCC